LGGDEVPVEADIAGFARFIIVPVMPDNRKGVPIDIEPYKEEDWGGEKK
jgi:hypothetical protein